MFSACHMAYDDLPRRITPDKKYYLVKYLQ